MRQDRGLKNAAAFVTSGRADTTSGLSSARTDVLDRRKTLFWASWYTCTALLLISILLLAYSSSWEYSTRSYLKGFSDAIVPAGVGPVEKIQAILYWMSGPAAEDTNPSSVDQDRNPEDTLNYTSLLKVCGTATNAFINLADSSGLTARRLLLLDSNRVTKHVVAEVLVGGRWIVVDPVFRYIPRGPDGGLLTRQQLTQPTIFAEATRNIPKYEPAYNYQITTHVHLSRLPIIGHLLRQTLNTLIPGWSDSPAISLLLERQSLLILTLSAFLVILTVVLRLVLRWYASARLDVRPVHAHQRLVRACRVFLKAAD